eukprot:TRINITY_DN3339_c0_g2_i2.p1 TRINITY_DN3339_c0_g2~~TRINITY_DN3339_c0_g2_i2.p1  ORF type:complete len:423 (+),score=100.67 TRINITY_DN3339_c0_g2_i2:149-1417(+)
MVAAAAWDAGRTGYGVDHHRPHPKPEKVWIYDLRVRLLTYLRRRQLRLQDVYEAAGKERKDEAHGARVEELKAGLRRVGFELERGEEKHFWAALGGLPGRPLCWWEVERTLLDFVEAAQARGDTRAAHLDLVRTWHKIVDDCKAKDKPLRGESSDALTPLTRDELIGLKVITRLNARKLRLRDLCTLTYDSGEVEVLPAELEAGLTRLGLPIAKQDVETIVRRCDVHDRGVIDCVEFESWSRLVVRKAYAQGRGAELECYRSVCRGDGPPGTWQPQRRPKSAPSRQRRPEGGGHSIWEGTSAAGSDGGPPSIEEEEEEEEELEDVFAEEPEGQDEDGQGDEDEEEWDMWEGIVKPPSARARRMPRTPKWRHMQALEVLVGGGCQTNSRNCLSASSPTSTTGNSAAVICSEARSCLSSSSKVS